MNACLKLCLTTCQAFQVRGRSSVPSSTSCSHSDCILVHPFVLFPFMKDRKYVAFLMGSLAMAVSLLSDINWQNLIRKSFVSFLLPSNFSGGFPSSRPHWGWSVVVYRSSIPKGLSPVPHGVFPFAVDDHSAMVSSRSTFDWILLALEGGRLCLRISTGLGSPLSTIAWTFIPSYMRWVTPSLLCAGHMAVRHQLCMAVSNHMPP